MTVLSAFTAFCQAFTELAKLAVELAPYLREWMDKTDETEIKSLLDLHSPAADLRAAILSDRIKRRQGADPVRPV